MILGFTDSFSILALSLYVTALPGKEADAPGTEAAKEATRPPVHDSANEKRRPSLCPI
jgi:hypothetical protein